MKKGYFINGESMRNRYSRQEVLSQFGKDGQKKLLGSKVVVIGCGALGTHIADNLARAGIGYLRIIDRDIVELNNLQRQTMFNEDDIGETKIGAALKKLIKINSEITIEPMVKDLHNGNIEELIDGFDLVMDATDNIPTRMIINDACIKHGIPWIYGGVIRSELMSMAIMPEGPCLRCLIPETPPAGSMTSCELAGVINTIPAIAAGIQCTEAYKILLNQIEDERKLIVYDVWHHHFHAVTVEKDDRCVCCTKKEFTYLDNPNRDMVLGLCQNSVQIIPPKETVLDLEQLADSLKTALNVPIANDYMVRFQAEGKQITLYKDGRALIKGTGDNGVAKAIYSRYVGL
jgi:adenylyltransferase/sulfurtransferase